MGGRCSNCFVAYRLSDWIILLFSFCVFSFKTNVSFIENSCAIKGSAVYISSLQPCSWDEEAPHYNPDKALRWSSNFVYRSNRLILESEAKILSHSKHDIATDTKRIQPANGAGATMKVRPLLKKAVSYFPQYMYEMRLCMYEMRNKQEGIDDSG